MTLTDALAAALHTAHVGCMTGFVCIPDDPRYADFHPASASAIFADPTFREALTAALAEALDAEEEAVGFTVYEAWPTAAAIVDRLLPATDHAANTADQPEREATHE